MKLPNTYRNSISFLGTIIAAIAFITIIILIVITKYFNVGSVYFDLFTFIVVPCFFIGGLVLISFGMFRAWRKRKSGTSKFPQINLNDKKQRNAAALFVIISVVFVIMTVFGTTEAVHYSESVEFCGTMCHSMNPEYTAYTHSPHARVRCAECHVGEGADYFVKAKISGMRQLYKTLINEFDKPIYTPITNLRPAAQTCEKCHWPQKFYTNNIRKEKYYLADSLNTEWNVVMDMKIGSSHQALGLIEGIHWHINPDIKIEYKANAKRDTIFWVKVINKRTKKETIFNDEEVTLTADSIKNIETRQMDCMDCHNRPSHEFRSPSHYVNDLFAANKIPQTIPWLKKSSMAALYNEYTSTDSAYTGIRTGIIAFYQKKYPAIYKKYAKEIKYAIDEIIEAYSNNAFPEMRVTYAKYPRHIGHLETMGCFRCHNDRYKSEDGKVISKRCDLCHTILAQGKKDSIKYSTIEKAVDFIHPVDIGDAWKESNCMDCHRELYK